ncbi:GNAT family N-acetyltransferase [Glaciecola sp. SC05]|uniref:GNAT family N-acetyltransferase n=1 Tax=Glaciecola sp. SC05 TaxID=1987355 RepID=UPI003527EB77
MDIQNIETQHLSEILVLNEISVAVLSPLNREKLLHLISQSQLAKVVLIENKVVAFLLAFGAKADYQSINYQWFNARYEAFLYIDRIVVSQAYRGKGIATEMYNYLVAYAVSASLPRLVAEIDIQPPNNASLKFHQRFEFVEVEQLIHSENKIVSLQSRSIGG